MDISKQKRVYLIIAAILMAAIAVGAQSPNSDQAIEGAWNVSVAFDQPGLPPCAPAPSVVIATSANRGTIIADSCYGTEGVGYGVWARTRHNEYAITFKGNSFAPNGIVAASYQVRATVSMDAPSNAFDGPFQTQLFDLSGNVLATLTGRVNAVRIAAQP